MNTSALKDRVMISAPYMIPVVERFRPVFAEAGIEIFVPHVEERLEEADLLPLVGDVDGIICGDDRLTRRVLERAPRLKCISKWGTGIDSIDRQACADLGIRLCNTPNAFTIPVADSTFAYMLAFARRTLEMDAAMKRGEWEKIPGFSLSEKTLGVVGVGNIGREVTRRARAFGMKVLGVDPVVPPPEFVASTGIEMTTLDRLLAQSDIVTLHTDLNPSSQHLINAGTLQTMKRGAYLINTSRGPVVHEVAMIDALRSGKLAGVGLDVFEFEPLPLDSPLRSMSNALIAPHNSNSSPAAWERVHQNTIKNLLSGLKEVRRWTNESLRLPA
jgi:D-3-phosphoglycerate dehydrogenase / 2-oxoglutarate reductase